MTSGRGAFLDLGMNFITTNAKGVTTIPFYRVGVWEGAFPYYQLMIALGLDLVDR